MFYFCGKVKALHNLKILVNNKEKCLNIPLIMIVITIIKTTTTTTIIIIKIIVIKLIIFQ